MASHTIFDLEKDYYLGNYQSCVNKATSMKASDESNYYLCLSYYHLKKFDILRSEVSKSESQCIKLVGLLASYENGMNGRRAIVEKLNSMLETKAVDSKDDLSRMVMATIYVREKMYSEALRALSQQDTMPALLLQTGVYLLMNRVDYAEKTLKVMQNKDDFSTITMLAVAQVKLAAGNAKEAYDVARELEDKYRPTPVLSNIQTAASILMNNFDNAKEHCECSLDVDNDNLEALINMLYILSRTKASNEIKERHFSRLKALYPNHEYVKEIGAITEGNY